MRGGEYPDDASKGDMRKGIIIGIVVVFTAASFTLGFFVGKHAGSGTEPSPALVEVEKPKAPEAPPPPVQRETVPMNLVSQTAEPQDAEQAGDQKSGKSAPSQQKTGKPGAAPLSALKTAQKDEPAKRSAEKEENHGAGSSTVSAREEKIVYTVQLGAFRNQSDADAVKTRFDKKGFKTYITVVKNKGEKVYKVRTGEFREKKDAEILSLKLKKTEGLNAFVTFKNG